MAVLCQIQMTMPDEWFAFHPTDTPNDWSESVTAVELKHLPALHGAAQQQGADVVPKMVLR